MALTLQKKGAPGAPVHAAKKQRQKYGPIKTTMNLAYHESSFHPAKVLPAVLIIAAAILIFSKVGIMDQLNKKAEAYDALGVKQDQLAAYTSKLADYDKLADEYGRYSYGWMTDSEASLVDRMDVIGLLEEKITPTAKIDDFAINDNTLTVNISGLTLEQTSTMVQDLETSPLVASVSVYTAKSENTSQAAQVSMTIVLQKEAA